MYIFCATGSGMCFTHLPAVELSAGVLAVRYVKYGIVIEKFRLDQPLVQLYDL
jgi:hypothetical protein